MELTWVDVDRCKPNNYNPNVMDAERFEALCDFLKTHGAEELDPIWVRKRLGEYEVVDGEHRWKAACKVGWRRLRAFILDIEEGDAKAFNVRKNRERGRIDAVKFGKILFEEHEQGSTCKQIAKKYGYADHTKISEFISIFENKDVILEQINVPNGTIISRHRAIQVLRELKHPKDKTEPIVDEMVEEVAPAIEKAFENVKPYNKHNPDRNKLVLNMLLKNLQEGLLFCPVCGKQMMECSGCHTSLEKMKEANQL